MLGSKADVRSGSGLPLLDTLLELGKTDRHPLGTVEDGLLARFIASIVPHGAVSIRDAVRWVMFPTISRTQSPHECGTTESRRKHGLAAESSSTRYRQAAKSLGSTA